MKKTLLLTILLFSIILSNAQWEIVTQNIGNGISARTDIEVAPDGTVYLAYLSYNSSAYHGMVKKLNGSSWETVGSGSVFELNTYFRFDLEIASDGTLFIAYNDETTGERKMSVSKFNGSDWELVGAQGFSAGEIQFPQLAFDSIDDPYVVYRDFANGHNATVQKFNGSDWELIGEAGFTEAGAWCTSIILDQNDIPYVAYQDWSNGQKISVDRFVGGQWETVGTPGFSVGEAWTTNMEIDVNNIPYVIYGDQGDGDNSYLKKWDGGSWETIGGGSFSQDGGLDANFIFDQNNDVYVVYQDYNVSQAPASVKKLVSNNWEYLGEAGFAGTNCRYTSIAIDNEGSVIIAYVEMYNGQALTVAKYPQEIIYPPTQQTLDIIFSNIDENSVEIDWTNGDGSSRVVFIKEGNTGEVEPTDNITYAANTIFGLGDEVGGWYCVYNGDGNAVSVSGLTVNTEYRVMVCEYNGSIGMEKYLTIPGSGNPANFSTLVSSLDEISEMDIRVYPNPTQGIISIHTSKIMLKPEIIITDVNGKMIVKTDNLNIDMSERKEGVYFILIRDKKSIFREKLIVK